jgi:hypothetical protein
VARALRMKRRMTTITANRDELEKNRKIRALIRRDPAVLEICKLLGVTINEFLDGLGPVNEREVLDGLDPEAAELGRELVSSAARVRAEASKEAQLEDLVDLDPVDHSVRARESIGA